MGKKIFAEANYDVSLILPIEEFRLFCDRAEGLYLCPEYKEQAVAAAIPLIDKQYPVITACDYLFRFRTGDRAHYEGLYFQRRIDLMTLAVAEKYEGEGRFTDKILDLVWMILEESTWVIPAHLNPNPSDSTHKLPYAYEGKRDYIDLFAGATGALIAWTRYLFKDSFEEISPVINKRIDEQLHDRIIVPFTEHTDTLSWMGNGKFNWINNWCPWVTSNVLTVCALTTKDTALRRRVAEIAFEALDKFTAIYGEDGACDEGPIYWGAACGALYNASLILYDMSGGRINAFRDPLMIKMGEFFPKAYICSDRYLNFSDAKSKMELTQRWGHDWGVLSGSCLMQSFWEYACDRRNEMPPIDHHMPYRFFRTLGAPEIKRGDFKAAKKAFFPSLDLSVCRESEDAQSGLYLSLKGYHNAASHNHLDVGNFVVFCDGMPIFIDAGVGTYTARTFNGDRYKIWSMRSEYHNLPTLNGVDQTAGRRYASKNAVYDGESGKLTLDLTNAYPDSADISSYLRSAVIEDGMAVITDAITSKKDGEVIFNLLCNVEPRSIEKGSFTIHGKRVTFDERLSLEVDSPDCTWPETKIIPEGWDCEKLYRIRLKGKLLAGEEYTARLEIFK